MTHETPSSYYFLHSAYNPFSSVLQSTHREGLVVELSTVDGLAAGAGPVREVATLDHELYHDIQSRYHAPGKMRYNQQSKLGVEKRSKPKLAWMLLFLVGTAQH